MNRHQTRRLAWIVAILLLLGIAAGLVLFALRQNINLFYTPGTAQTASLQPGQVIRLGGYVEEHSVHYTASGEQVVFYITDRQHRIRVTYHGVLPTLFREGQGIVVTGTLNPTKNFFTATQVLAKHDEKYRPPLLKELPHAS